MSILDKLLSRRSIRAYSEEQIPSHVLNKIIEAGRQAPSAGNRQPWHFIIITDEEIKQRFSWGRVNWFIKDAPLLIVGCANTGNGTWPVVDTTIALQNMVIAAWVMGVGSCWLGSFRENEVKKLLKIPEGWKVVSLITFGYPAEGENRFPANFQEMRERLTKKKPLEEITSYNKFQR